LVISYLVIIYMKYCIFVVAYNFLLLFGILADINGRPIDLVEGDSELGQVKHVSSRPGHVWSAHVWLRSGHVRQFRPCPIMFMSGQVKSCQVRTVQVKSVHVKSRLVMSRSGQCRKEQGNIRSDHILPILGQVGSGEAKVRIGHVRSPYILSGRCYVTTCQVMSGQDASGQLNGQRSGQVKVRSNRGQVMSG